MTQATSSKNSMRSPDSIEAKIPATVDIEGVDFVDNDAKAGYQEIYALWKVNQELVNEQADVL